MNYAVHPQKRRIFLAILVLVLSVPFIYSFGVTGIAEAASSNPTATENQKTGTTLWQPLQNGLLLSSDTPGEIKGYASASSVNKGGNIDFHITVSSAQTYSIDIYRIGWYNGAGGRLMKHVGSLKGVQQPPCPIDLTTGLIECHWSVGYTLAVPTTWTSGVYEAHLINAQGYENYIIFVVRDDSRTADFLFPLPFATYQAYNNYPYDGVNGKSLYGYNSFGTTTIGGSTAAVKVSFDRPYEGHGDGQFSVHWNDPYYDIHLVHWLESRGYDIAYSTDIDTHTDGARLLNYKGIITASHDEYWSKQMYDAFEAARDASVNIAFFGANNVYWQTRLESSSSGVPNRIMVVYRDAQLDPEPDPTLKTIEWRDLGRPEQTLIGIMYDSIVSPSNVPYVVANSLNWVYANTGLVDGSSVAGIVGNELDRTNTKYPLPANTAYTILSNSPYTPALSTTTITANSSIYQAPSDALVFAAGTIAWGWALDKVGYISAGIQQMTKNVLDQFIQPKQKAFANNGIWTGAGNYGNPWYIGDFNGDGKTDIARYYQSVGMEVFLSSGSSFTYSGIWTGAGSYDNPWIVGDFNGDGKADIARYYPSVGTEVFLSNGSSFTYSGIWNSNGNFGDQGIVGDFNGDGKTDIARYYSGVGMRVFLSNGLSFTDNGIWTGAGNYGNPWYIGDFNGDGKTDIARYYQSVGMEVFLSSGSSFTYSGIWTGAGSYDNPWIVGDFNGDGKADIARYYNGTCGADIFISTGSSFGSESCWTKESSGTEPWYVGNFNGNGKADIFRYNPSTGVEMFELI